MKRLFDMSTPASAPSPNPQPRKAGGEGYARPRSGERRIQLEFAVVTEYYGSR